MELQYEKSQPHAKLSRRGPQSRHYKYRQRTKGDHTWWLKEGVMTETHQTGVTRIHYGQMHQVETLSDQIKKSQKELNNGC